MRSSVMVFLIIVMVNLSGCQSTPVPTVSASLTSTPLPIITPLPTVAATLIEKPILSPSSTPASTSTRTPTASTTFSQVDLSGSGKIAFRNDDGWYWVINADGTNAYKLADPIGGGHYTYPDDGCSQAAWSPMGTQLALIRDGNIFVLSSDGANAQKITDTNHQDHCIAWSPDGDYLAISSSRADVIERGVYYVDIFVVRPDGSDLKKITSSNQFCGSPSWSPNGKWLVFDCSSGGSNVYLSSRDGSQLWSLTSDSSSRNPVWSPVGGLIAFESRGGSSDYNQYNIYVMDTNGNNNHKLTNNNRSFLPRWSPDGKSIMYMYTSDDGNYELRIMEADGKNERLLVKDINIFSLPSWSPDGRYITYGSGSDLYVFEMKSGNFIKLAAGYDPIWSPKEVQQLPDCTSGWTRLTIGGKARVTGGPTDLPNRVRSEPNRTAEIIAQIYPGTTVKISEGPICVDGLVFWKVENATIPGGSGWTAEGDGKEYWLEPQK